eukprot:TRINITY_DN6436_c0_g1_i3.p1 TRINITY_DN6436_c0_g1~~TRINITY_DN6436_c0_g1_i3.p1  ORF type:complete len:989 (+),score=150.79 TRINITY_DN6436_c0_g1_i3:190-3156(+)
MCIRDRNQLNSLQTMSTQIMCNCQKRVKETFLGFKVEELKLDKLKQQDFQILVQNAKFLPLISSHLVETKLEKLFNDTFEIKGKRSKYYTESILNNKLYNNEFVKKVIRIQMRLITNPEQMLTEESSHKIFILYGDLIQFVRQLCLNMHVYLLRKIIKYGGLIPRNDICKKELDAQDLDPLSSNKETKYVHLASLRNFLTKTLKIGCFLYKDAYIIKNRKQILEYLYREKQFQSIDSIYLVYDKSPKQTEELDKYSAVYMDFLLHNYSLFVKRTISPQNEDYILKYKSKCAEFQILQCYLKHPHIYNGLFSTILLSQDKEIFLTYLEKYLKMYKSHVLELIQVKNEDFLSVALKNDCVLCAKKILEFYLSDVNQQDRVNIAYYIRDLSKYNILILRQDYLKKKYQSQSLIVFNQQVSIFFDHYMHLLNESNQHMVFDFLKQNLVFFNDKNLQIIGKVILDKVKNEKLQSAFSKLIECIPDIIRYKRENCSNFQQIFYDIVYQTLELFPDNEDALSLKEQVYITKFLKIDQCINLYKNFGKQMNYHLQFDRFLRKSIHRFTIEQIYLYVENCTIFELTDQSVEYILKREKDNPTVVQKFTNFLKEHKYLVNLRSLNSKELIAALNFAEKWNNNYMIQKVRCFIFWFRVLLDTFKDKEFFNLLEINEVIKKRDLQLEIERKNKQKSIARKKERDENKVNEQEEQNGKDRKDNQVEEERDKDQKNKNQNEEESEVENEEEKSEEDEKKLTESNEQEYQETVQNQEYNKCMGYILREYQEKRMQNSMISSSNLKIFYKDIQGFEDDKPSSILLYFQPIKLYKSLLPVNYTESLIFNSKCRQWTNLISISKFLNSLSDQCIAMNFKILQENFIDTLQSPIEIFYYYNTFIRTLITHIVRPDKLIKSEKQFSNDLILGYDESYYNSVFQTFFSQQLTNQQCYQSVQSWDLYTQVLKDNKIKLIKSSTKNIVVNFFLQMCKLCLLYTSPSPRDQA